MSEIYSGRIVEVKQTTQLYWGQVTYEESLGHHDNRKISQPVFVYALCLTEAKFKIMGIFQLENPDVVKYWMYDSILNQPGPYPVVVKDMTFEPEKPE